MDRATIVPGHGVGSMTLGMPLQEFRRRYPGGRVLAIVSDDGLSLEFRYGGSALAARFDLPEACRKSLPARGAAAATLEGGADFYRTHPSCANAPLQSIAIESGHGRDLATDRGIHVGSRRDEVLAAYAVSIAELPRSLAGESPDDGQYLALGFSGLVVYFEAAVPSTPNGALAPDAIVRRIIVVPRA